MTDENHSGARVMLKAPSVYRFLQSLVGKSRAWRHVHKAIWRIEPGFKVIDIGCGPRPLLNSITFPIDYIGIDIDPAYIVAARKSCVSNEGRFFVGTAQDFINNPSMSNADVILCNGVLHHLSDDEVSCVLTFGEKHLKAGKGRFTAIEPCHLAFESRMSTWIMKQDRGRYVRTESEWKRIVGAHKNLHSETRILTSMSWIPYHHIVLDCTIPSLFTR